LRSRGVRQADVLMFLPSLPFEFLNILILRKFFIFILLSCRLRAMQHSAESTPNYASLRGVATLHILLMLRKYLNMEIYKKIETLESYIFFVS
jgi:hypothetical protein